jgi:hypothetical protein
LQQAPRLDQHAGRPPQCKHSFVFRALAHRQAAKPHAEKLVISHAALQQFAKFLLQFAAVIINFSLKERPMSINPEQFCRRQQGRR